MTEKKTSRYVVRVPDHCRGRVEDLRVLTNGRSAAATLTHLLSLPPEALHEVAKIMNAHSTNASSDSSPHS